VESGTIVNGWLLSLETRNVQLVNGVQWSLDLPTR
jgi:hypothetical protein